jgi:hypothetical protein
VAKVLLIVFQPSRPLLELVPRTAGPLGEIARQFLRQFAFFPALHQFRKFYLNSPNLENTKITNLGQGNSVKK